MAEFLLEIKTQPRENQFDIEKIAKSISKILICRLNLTIKLASR